jgi:nucleoside phosphorylase
MPYGGKYDENGFSTRPREFAADSHLLGVARKVRRDRIWIERIKNPPGTKPLPIDRYPVAFPPLGHIAPAVSTEAVVANTESDLANLIATSYGDACIVEMEGYGAIYAASQEQKPAIVIRGVSDMIEKKIQRATRYYSRLLPVTRPLSLSNCLRNGDTSIRRGILKMARRDPSQI